MTLDEWVETVCTELGLGPVDVAEILDLARDVAHGVARPAAPLTCLLIGLAVGAGTPMPEVLTQVRALLPAPTVEQPPVSPA